MSYYDVSDIVKELGGMFFHHTSMMTTLRTSVVTVGGVMTAGAPTLYGPATAASTHEGRRVQGLLLNRAVQLPRRLHLHRAAELGFGANLWAVVAGGGASHRHPHVRQGASPSRRPLGVPATLIEPLNGVTTH